MQNNVCVDLTTVTSGIMGVTGLYLGVVHNS